MTRQVAFVAPLPPPVHGFSNICAAMLDLLRMKSPISVFDRAPRTPNPWYAALHQLAMPMAYFVWSAKNPGGKLYLALSGGLGQFFDWPFVLIARLFGRCIIVHHHSFAYITSPSILNRLLFAGLRRQIHVVLSPRMGQELVRIYGLNSANVRVISNAAFFAAVAQPSHRSQNADAPIRLGYLSNISLEKGIVEFFAVLDELHRSGIAYEAQIGGPVAPTAQAVFSRLLASAHYTTYCGPIYDDAKDRFYNDLDVLLFPSDYVNEAEPLVVHEAIRSGAHVIACERGSIADILSNGAGLVFPKAAFTAAAASHIREFSSDRALLRRAQQASFEQARRMRDSAGEHLSALVDEIAGDGNGSLQTC
jgi:glycosyltransferase involved in cell wall biosynthesis